MLRADYIARQVQHLAEADAFPMAEVLLRRVLVLLSGSAIAFGMADPVFAIWGTGYVLLDIVYVAVIRRIARAPSFTGFVLAHLLSLAVGLCVAFMSIYMAWIEEGALFFVAACLVVGQALHCLSSHESLSLAAIIDYLIVAIATFGVTVPSALYAETPEIGMIFVIGGLAVLVYFGHSLRKMIAQREELRQRTEREKQGEKMRALGQLTSGVAHDFNNLLTVIGGNIELAQLQTLPDEARDLLSEAQAATNNAALLVSRLLAYSRKSTLSIARHPCDDIFERIEKLAMRLLPANIACRVAPPGPDFVIYVDAAMLEAALLNLIVNARDAIGDGQGEITLFATARVDLGALELVVTDTGPGMDPETLSKATDPFFTTKQAGEGSGLGLSMVKGFAEQSGGQFRLENRGGGGLRATLTLPCARARDARAPAAPPRRIPRSAS